MLPFRRQLFQREGTLHRISANAVCISGVITGDFAVAGDGESELIVFRAVENAFVVTR